LTSILAYTTAAEVGVYLYKNIPESSPENVLAVCEEIKAEPELYSLIIISKFPAK
jgi:hypothetical protein